MTSDEMQRAIEFLLSSQANFEIRFEKTQQQMELTNQRISLLAETQTEFIQAMTGHVDSQREINADLRRTMRELAQAQKTTQHDISDLTKTVDGLVKTFYKNGNPS